jgi:hypothetical protein
METSASFEARSAPLLYPTVAMTLRVTPKDENRCRLAGPPLE